MSLSNPEIEQEVEDNNLEHKANELKANLPMSTQQKRDIAEASQNPDNITKMAAQNQADRQQGKETSISNGFFEALGFFLPTIVGGAVGGAIGGNEGVVQGAKLGMEASDSYRKFKADQLSRIPTPSELIRMEQAQTRIGLTKKELEIREKGQEDLQKDRAFRASERDVKLVNSLKKEFNTRKDVAAIRTNVDDMDTIEDIVTTGKKIPGALLNKVARTINKDVGTMGEGDIKRAQVNPSIWGNIKRGYYNNFQGEVSPTDAAEIIKIAKVFREKQISKLKSKIPGFAKSRGKTNYGDVSNQLASDLGLEFELEEPKKEDQSFSREEIEEAKRKIRESKKK